jgi:hypothetical protein
MEVTVCMVGLLAKHARRRVKPRFAVKTTIKILGGAHYLPFVTEN